MFNKEYCIDTIINLKDEEWREIYNTKGKYFISNKGRVKSLCSYEARILKGYTSKNGYLRVKINKKEYYIHRLVGLHFIENSDYNADTIHHRDSDRKNNELNNL